MRVIAAVVALLLMADGTLWAQSGSWDEVCVGSSSQPSRVFAQYTACPMVLPDSVALTTTPRTDEFIGWFSGYSVSGEWLRVALDMPMRSDTIMLAVVEAHCADSTPLPMIIFQCKRNYGGVMGDIPGALLTDSLIAAGQREAFIRVRSASGELLPARFVPQVAPDDPRPGVVGYKEPPK